MHTGWRNTPPIFILTMANQNILHKTKQGINTVSSFATMKKFFLGAYNQSHHYQDIECSLQNKYIHMFYKIFNFKKNEMSYY